MRIYYLGSRLFAIVISLFGILLSCSNVSATISADTKPIQFVATGHVIGFDKQEIYLVAGDHQLKVQFNGSPGAQPISTATGNQRPTSNHNWKVAYTELWPGIDLSYETTAQGLFESTWEIAPGADPEQIQLHYSAPVVLAHDGGLRIDYAHGWMRESKPIAWQQIDGKTVPVEVAFRQISNSDTSAIIGFDLGEYDTDYPLLIDPVVQWDTFVGSTTVSGASITQDASGNIYIVGSSNGSWGTPVHAYAGGDYDVFIAKLDASGAYQWHTFLGSSVTDNGLDIALDGLGGVYVTGLSGATWGTPNHAYAGGSGDAFVAKLQASNGSLVWNTFLGSTGYDIGSGIIVDGLGNSYVAGSSDASWGSTGTIKRAYGGSRDAFVSKVGLTGTIAWNTFLGSSGWDEGKSITKNSNGDLLIAGTSGSSWGSPVTGFTGGDDVFTAAVNSSGVLQWNTFMGGSGSDEQVSSIQVDSSDNVYVGGHGDGTWSNNPVRAYTGGNDVFAVKLSDTGVRQWTTFLGASANDTGGALTVNHSGQVIVSGSSYSTWGSPVNYFSGFTDAFTAALSSANGTMAWNSFLGGTSTDLSSRIISDASNGAYLVGTSYGAWGYQFPTPVNSFSGYGDAFVAKIDTRNGYTVSTSVTAGSGHFNFSSRSILEGDTTEATATPSTGYSIASVSGCSGTWSGSNPYTTGPITADCTISGTFTPTLYNVVPSAGANGSISPNTTQQVAYGNTTQFTVTPDPNFTATVIGTCGGTLVGTTYTTNTITQNCTVDATFVPNSYTVDTNIVSGQGTITPSSTSVSHGDTASFSITPATHYSIGSVSGCGGSWSGSNPYTTAAITAPCTISATFTPDSYTINASVDAHGSLDSSSQQGDYGSTVSFTLTPDAGYVPNFFVGGDCPAGSWSASTYTTGPLIGACSLSFTHSPINYGVSPYPGPTSELLSAGGSHSLAVKSDGTVVAWGANWHSQITVPTDLTSVVAVSAGYSHSLALKSDGTVVAWGSNSDGEASVPTGLDSVIAVSAGDNYSLALKADGTIVGWGDDYYGQATPPSGLSRVIAIAAGSGHSLALANARVVGWGYDYYGQATPPSGLTSVVAIAAGDSHSLALKADGTVMGWGDDYYGQATPPSGLSSVIAIAAGGSHSLALKSDGTIVGWGYNGDNETTIPSPLVMLPFHGIHGTISPNTPQRINTGTTTTFTLHPDTGYISSVTGTCGGTLVGNAFTTNPVTGDCNVEASFNTGHTVNASVDAHGTLDKTETLVSNGDTASFTVTPATGYLTDSAVGGNCPAGAWIGQTYTTGTVTTPCSVSFTHSPMLYSVTPSTTGHGVVAPDTPQSVGFGSSTQFTLTPDSGYHVNHTVNGTCTVGNWSGNSYTTGAINSNCSAIFGFTADTACTESGGLLTISNQTFASGDVVECRTASPINVGPNAMIQSGAALLLTSASRVTLIPSVSINPGALFIADIDPTATAPRPTNGSPPVLRSVQVTPTPQASARFVTMPQLPQTLLQRLRAANAEATDISTDQTARYYLFTTRGGLTGLDENNLADVYWYDNGKNDLALVSARPDGMAGNADSLNPRMDASGQIIVYQSAASDLITDDSNGVTDLFMTDTRTWLNERISLTINGQESPLASMNPSIDGSGSQVYYERASGNHQEIYRYSVSELITDAFSASITDRMHSTHHPAVSGDGRFVTFLQGDVTDHSSCRIIQYNSADSAMESSACPMVFATSVEELSAHYSENDTEIIWTIGADQQISVANIFHE